MLPGDFLFGKLCWPLQLFEFNYFILIYRLVVAWFVFNPMFISNWRNNDDSRLLFSLVLERRNVIAEKLIFSSFDFIYLQNFCLIQVSAFQRLFVFTQTTRSHKVWLNLFALSNDSHMQYELWFIIMFGFVLFACLGNYFSLSCHTLDMFNIISSMFYRSWRRLLQFVIQWFFSFIIIFLLNHNLFSLLVVRDRDRIHHHVT